MAHLNITPKVRRDGGGSVPVRLKTESTSVTFQMGSLLRIVNTTGATTGCVSGVNTGTNTTVSAGTITTASSAQYGIALAPASGTALTKIPVAILTHDVEVFLPAIHGTAASAIPTKAMEEQQFALSYYTPSSGSNPVLGVAIDITTNPCFVVTEVPDGSVGQLNGGMWGKIVAAERADSVL